GKIRVRGWGGIVKVEDVVEYMLAGASAGMIGYLTFRNPSGMIAIIEGLEKWCERRGFARVADLTGGMIFDRPAPTLEAAAAPIGEPSAVVPAKAGTTTTKAVPNA